MNLIFAPLFSGSSGNSLYVGGGGHHILVDAGVSGSRILSELRTIGVTPDALDAILVTHEHVDHIRAVGILSRKLDLPVYASEGTWDAMADKIGEIAPRNIRIFEPKQAFYVGDIEVCPFPTPHDAAQSVGYSFCLGTAKFSVATDIGCIRDSWLKYVVGSHAVVLESNYDPDMLMAGSYPYLTKKRIASSKGHLSNDDAAAVAVELACNGTQRILLGHLSKENNFPELAMQTTVNALREAGHDTDLNIAVQIAKRDGLSGAFLAGSAEEGNARGNI